MKRTISAFLALALCLALLPLPARAAQADYGCRLLSVGVSLTKHYIKYTYGGATYYSHQTAWGTNADAWRAFSDGDKLKVTSWYAGFNSQMEAQFGTAASEMRDYALEASGWKQAGEKLRANLAKKYYPELEAFFGPPDGVRPTPDLPLLEQSQRRQLTAEELREYDELRNEVQVLYAEGVAAYRTLIELKQKQTAAAVTGISGELVKTIMGAATGGRPGGTLKDLGDAFKDFVDQRLGISDKIKEISGISRLTGEDKLLSPGAAAQVIKLFWNLMDVQEKISNKSIEMIESREARLRSINESYISIAERRAKEKAEENERLQQTHEDSLKYRFAPVDIDPNIDVKRSDYSDPEAYQYAALAAAKRWAEEEFWKNYEAFKTMYATGFDPSLVDHGEAARAKQTHWYADNCWTNDYAPEDQYAEWFAGYLAKHRETHDYDLELLSLDASYYFGVSWNDPEADEWLRLIDEGYDNAIDRYEQNIPEYEAYVQAWEAIRASFKTYAIPYVNRAYNLVQKYCTYSDEGYGNWGVGEDALERFVDLYEQYCNSLLRGTDDAVIQHAEEMIEYLKAQKDDVHRRYEQSGTVAPRLYRLLEYTHNELDYGLWLFHQSVTKLEALQAGYPDWLKDVNVAYSPIAGGGVPSGDHGVTEESLYRFWLADVKGVDEQIRVMETSILPILRGYYDEEQALLLDMQRAEGIIKQAVQERSDAGVEYYCDAVNRMELGPLTFKPSWEMYEDYDYYRYRYLGAKRPEATTALSILIRDLEGESPYIAKMRALRRELLENIGSLCRKAADGTLYDDGTFNNYYRTGQDSLYTVGLYGDARHRSYRDWDVWNYWYQNVKPILDALSAVYRGETTYIPVSALTPSPTLHSADETLAVGQTVQLRVTVVPDDATVPDVLWTTSDDGVAAVDEYGRVRGVAPGTAEVTATAVDSIGAAPIAVSFTVEVAGDLAALGEGVHVLGLTARADGKTADVAGLLYAAGDQLEAATAVVAVYDASGRFLGSAMRELTVQDGLTADLSTQVELASAHTGALDARVFLLQSGTLTPLALD